MPTTFNQSKNTLSATFFTLIPFLVITTFFTPAAKAKTLIVQQNTNQNELNGSWFLTNPKILSKEIVAGALNICNPKQDKKCQGLTLVLLQKDGRYGCTDFVGMGEVNYDQSKKAWVISLQDDTSKEKILWGQASINARQQLVVTPIESTLKLTYTSMPQETIEAKINARCRSINSHSGQ